MNTDFLNTLFVWALGLVLGVSIGVTQESFWSQQRESITSQALITQINDQDCDDLIYPEIIRTVKHEAQTHPVKKSKHP